ncbi:MAG: hypothetical protein SGJ11_14490, partial [Phycisphaerae bacterium]|nr:hypothetical protein [Phycisphaerae bacterium]
MNRRHCEPLASVGLAAALLTAGLTGCAHRGPTAPLLEGMGTHRRPTSTRVVAAQTYFDQGLVWTFACNHDEAIRSFTRATELDPSLAIAWWGIALCHGPHINNPVMPEEGSKLAFEALAKAQQLRAHPSPVEQALIDALAARYRWPAPADRKPLDEAYAAAMRGVYERVADDHDIATLHAESLMDLQPWDLWTRDGQPKGNADEVVRVLERVLAANPRHPGAAHLYIHAVEAPPAPERAVPAAAILRTLVPASGHLTHMPAHIDVGVGRWDDAAEQNRRAIVIYAAYRKASPRQGFYRLYMQHNQQFLSFACMMLGRCEEALCAGRAAVSTLPAAWIQENASVMDGYMTVHMDALKRFAKWDEILARRRRPRTCRTPQPCGVSTARWRMPCSTRPTLRSWSVRSSSRRTNACPSRRSRRSTRRGVCCPLRSTCSTARLLIRITVDLRARRSRQQRQLPTEIAPRAHGSTAA